MTLRSWLALAAALAFTGCTCAGPGQPCSPTAPNSCPEGLICRPSAEGAICQTPETAGRIPSCRDEEAMDVFAVEANRALSISWTVNAAVDSSGGFRVRYGTAPGQYPSELTVAAGSSDAVLSGLTNDTLYFVAVEALGADAAVTLRSCEVFATPHVLVFQPEVRVNSDTAGVQARPALTSNGEGTRLYLAFEDSGQVVLTTSTDFGATWSPPVPVSSGTGQTRPALAVRDAETDEAGAVLSPELAFVAWEESGSVAVAAYSPQDGTFATAVTLGSGDAPDLAAGDAHLFVGSASSGAIKVHRSGLAPLSFGASATASGATTAAAAPAIAVREGSVFVAWSAQAGSGDSNIYFAASDDLGDTFGAPVRIDDDTGGQNQLNVSLAADPKTGTLYATWEDRRGGANVFFSASTDQGASWSANVDVGAGLGGDQFRPDAVVDVARNVYVAFQDTTNGARVVFSRFGSQGTFDPPLAPSTAAGSGGVVADHPAVATDRYGAVYVAWQENRSGSDTDIFFARAE